MSEARLVATGIDPKKSDGVVELGPEGITGGPPERGVGPEEKPAGGITPEGGPEECMLEESSNGSNWPLGALLWVPGAYARGGTSVMLWRDLRWSCGGCLLVVAPVVPAVVPVVVVPVVAVVPVVEAVRVLEASAWALASAGSFLRSPLGAGLRLTGAFLGLANDAAAAFVAWRMRVELISLTTWAAISMLMPHKSGTYWAQVACT